MDYENDESMEAQHLEYTISCSSTFMRRCTDFQFGKFRKIFMHISCGLTHKYGNP